MKHFPRAGLTGLFCILSSVSFSASAEEALSPIQVAFQDAGKYVQDVFAPALGTSWTATPFQEGLDRTKPIAGLYVKSTSPLCDKVFVADTTHIDAPQVTSKNFVGISSSIPTVVYNGMMGWERILEGYDYIKGLVNPSQDYTIKKYALNALSEEYDFQEKLEDSIRLYSQGKIKEAKEALGTPHFCAADGEQRFASELNSELKEKGLTVVEDSAPAEQPATPAALRSY